MSGTPVMTDRSERTSALLAAEDTIDVVCAAIACGSTLAEWTRDRDISYNVVNAWIEEDESRRDRYASALVKRDAHNKDIITTALRNFMDFDPLTCLTNDGGVRDLKEIPIATRRCIVSIEVEELFAGRGEDREKVGELKKIKFSDRNRAAETLARTLRMLTDKKEIEVGDDLASLLTKSGAK